MVADQIQREFPRFGSGLFYPTKRVSSVSSGRLTFIIGSFLTLLNYRPFFMPSPHRCRPGTVPYPGLRSCKQRLVHADTTRLAHPVLQAKLRLSTDASSVAVGAVLEQKTEKGWLPLGFFSRKLLNAQAKYSAYDRELLAAFLTTRHFMFAIEGRQTTLRTDHL